MPGQGSTLRECVVCHTMLNVACKTCKTCRAEQPHKLRLKKKIEKFDKKRESWVNTHVKNRTASHICDEGYILLEKLQALGVRAVLFISKPGRKPDSWVSEVLAPRCQLSETSSTCLERMKSLYDIVIQGWLPQGTTGQLGEPSSTPVDPPAGPPMASSDPQNAHILGEPVDPQAGPPTASPDPPVPVAFDPPAASVAPVTLPPLTTLPLSTPAVPTPPVTRPPVTRPPVTTPAVPTPPVTRPPVTRTPVTTPPATRPPATTPPATTPPATTPPATTPPATRPPATTPPATTPPATRPPATRPPATTPPATRPPATRPPATTPPATRPPATTPPATRPPATTPTATRPPVTQTEISAASAGPHAALTGSQAHGTRKRKECPHTVSGSQDFYPVKRVSKCKVMKGKKMKLVEWEPCKLCGKKWPLEWVLDEDTC